MLLVWQEDRCKYHYGHELVQSGCLVQNSVDVPSVRNQQQGATLLIRGAT